MAQINKPNEYFNTVLYSGNGSYGNSITGVGFQPDWVWIKSRNNVYSHQLYDAVRGVDKNLQSDLNDAEGTGVNLLHSFDSDGFTVDDDNRINNGSTTYASWNWLANGTGVSNTDGSITSTVSANTTSGFSIVSYTGTGANATVGHGLGVAPKMIIFKNRTVARNWIAYHDSIGATKFMYFNLNNAETTDSTAFNNTAPTSSVFSLGSNVGGNESGSSMIAYCFSEVKGFSKIGSYTGNGNADGTFVYTGFKPAWVIMKRTDTTNDWFIFDSTRNTFNETDLRISANSSSAESDQTGSNPIDILSNGFKCRGNAGATNASGGTYIYMAFASEPLVGSNNIPAVAR